MFLLCPVAARPPIPVFHAIAFWAVRRTIFPKLPISLPAFLYERLRKSVQSSQKPCGRGSFPATLGNLRPLGQQQTEHVPTPWVIF